MISTGFSSNRKIMALRPYIISCHSKTEITVHLARHGGCMPVSRVQLRARRCRDTGRCVRVLCFYCAYEGERSTHWTKGAGLANWSFDIVPKIQTSRTQSPLFVICMTDRTFDVDALTIYYIDNT